MTRHGYHLQPLSWRFDGKTDLSILIGHASLFFPAQ
jgi:hypothetical protein